jgi:hypothetical protein
MSSVTKRLLAEQIMYRLDSPPDTNIFVQFEDLYKAIEQKVNAMFRMQYFSATLPSGETVPDSLSLGAYDGVEVTSLSNGRSKSVLPVIPIALPRNMGVYEIQDTEGQSSFVPLLPTQRVLLKSQPLINDLLGLIGYEVKGNVIEYTKDLTLFGMNKVNMLLVVMDMERYSETDILPIPADYQETIVDELYKQFAGIAIADAKAVAK